MRKFSQVATDIWQSDGFRGLSGDDPRLLLLYLIANRNQNGAGCFQLPEGYACADLAWSDERYKGALSALSKAKLVTYDPQTREVFVEGWYRINRPATEKHRTHVSDCIGEIRSDIVREAAERSLKGANDEAIQRQRKKDSRPNVELLTTTNHFRRGQYPAS